ncbi:uncharacterized protein LOC143601033 [Bidens hawaiensis]|uniref:uncharacterized protein LOC143601033 n=1 Tax=Bidens hawaiensis TaxID=980011 RepID=UPI00404AD717
MTNGKELATPATAPLHPIYTVTNIQNNIRTLDGTKVSYSSWVKLFLLHAHGYDWIYGTLSDNLLTRVLENESTAYEAWTRIRNLFLNNKGARAAALEQEFVNLKLASFSSLEAYFLKLKELAEKLKDVESPVTENRLVLQLVRGLPREYDSVGSFINQQLPTWESACSMVQLEQHRQHAREPSPPPVVAAAIEQPGNHVAPPEQRRDNQPFVQSHGPTNQRRQGLNTRRPTRTTTGSSSNAANTSAGPSRGNHPPWPAQSSGYWHPYWAPPPPCPYPTQSGWASPWQPNSSPWYPQASRPPTRSGSQPQAHLADLNPLEPTNLGYAFDAMTMQPPDESWFMDTGATNHLSADSGMVSSSSRVTPIKSILIGNGQSIPILGSGNTTLPGPSRDLYLNDVLISPNIFKNLVFVRRFAIDN